MALQLQAELVEDPQQKVALQNKSSHLERKYEDYIEKFGVKESVHIPRESGNEMSLLTQLVYTN